LGNPTAILKAGDYVVMAFRDSSQQHVIVVDTLVKEDFKVSTINKAAGCRSML